MIDNESLLWKLEDKEKESSILPFPIQLYHKVKQIIDENMFLFTECLANKEHYN